MTDEYTISIDNREKTYTSCGDIIQILEFKKDFGKYSTGYKLYKASTTRPSYNKETLEREPYKEWRYYIFFKDDQFPMYISEEQVNEIMQNPEKGYDLAYNWFQDRYR